MRTLLRAALALLLAAPALHRPQAAGDTSHSGVRPREEWLLAAPSQRQAADAPAPRRLRPPPPHGPVPPAFLAAADP
jgi:hypothetical protein